MKHSQLFILFSFALCLSACAITSHTTVQADGSATLAYEVGLDKNDLQTLQGLGETPEEFCESMHSEGGLPKGSKITHEQRGDLYYCIVIAPYASLQDLRSEYGTKGVTIRHMELVDKKFDYDITIDGATLISGGGGQFSNFQPTLNWQVTAPGLIGANNADKVDGNTLTWVVSTTQPTDIQVESTVTEPVLPGGNLGLIVAAVCGCLLCVGAVGAGGGGFYWWTRRKQTEPEPTPVELGTVIYPPPAAQNPEPDPIEGDS